MNFPSVLCTERVLNQQFRNVDLLYTKRQSEGLNSAKKKKKKKKKNWKFQIPKELDEDVTRKRCACAVDRRDRRSR